jgi:hypothetical protein
MHTMQQDDFRANTADLKGLAYQGKVYIFMPFITHGECNGCYFQGNDVDCPHTDKLIKCDVDSPILIEDTPEALAEYVAWRLE